MSQRCTLFLVVPANITFGTGFIPARWPYVLAAAVLAANIDIELRIIDETIAPFDPRDVKNQDLVCIGIMTDNCIAGYRVARAAKERGAIVIAGGIHATILPEEPFEFGADAVCVGNGDLIFPTIVKDALSGKLKRRYDGGRTQGGQMVIPRWELLNPRHYWMPPVVSVAGCPKSCSFCSVWRTDGHDPRERTAEDIIYELSLLRRMGFRMYILADDNVFPFSLNHIAGQKTEEQRRALEAARKHRFDAFERIANHVAKEPMYAFTQMTAELGSDPDVLKLLRRAKIRAGLVGVESPSAEGLKSIKKGWNPVGDKMIEAIQNIQNIGGISVLASIIAGLASDTPESVAALLDFALKTGAHFVQFTNLDYFPGTVDFDMAVRRLQSGTNGSTSEKHVEITRTRYWLDEDRSREHLVHPRLERTALRNMIVSNWNNFYSFPQILRRAVKLKDWPLVGVLAYIFGSKAFNTFYNGNGLSADSARKRNAGLAARLLMKGGRRIFLASSAS